MKDLRGCVFGRLTVIEPTDKRYAGQVVWKCQCECGNECEVPSHPLSDGRIKSCGCLKQEMANEFLALNAKKAGRKPKDLTGQTFGRLTALEPTDKRIRGSIVWHCKCECGNECEVRSSYLLNGRIRSCGCLRRERASEWGRNKSVAKKIVAAL